MRKCKSAITSGDSLQAVIETYKKDVDRSMIRQMLQLTVEERLLNLENFVEFCRRASNGRKAYTKRRFNSEVKASYQKLIPILASKTSIYDRKSGPF